MSAHVGTFMRSGPGEVAKEDSPYPVFWFAATACLNPSLGNRPGLGTFSALLWMFSLGGSLSLCKFVSHVLACQYTDVWREAAWATLEELDPMG